MLLLRIVELLVNVVGSRSPKRPLLLLLSVLLLLLFWRWLLLRLLLRLLLLLRLAGWLAAAAAGQWTGACRWPASYSFVDW